MTSSTALPDADRSAPDLRPAAVPLVGDLDLTVTERLRAQLDDLVVPGRRLALDVSQVTSLSSAALAVLVGAHRRLRAVGGTLVLCSPSPAVVREMRVSGLYRVIEVDGLSEEMSAAY